MKKITDEEWNEINEAIAKDGDGRATGLYYAPEMRCEKCGDMTDRNEMIWVRVRIIIPPYGRREMRCKGCAPYTTHVRSMFDSEE